MNAEYDRHMAVARQRSADALRLARTDPAAARRALADSKAAQDRAALALTVSTTVPRSSTPTIVPRSPKPLGRPGQSSTYMGRSLGPVKYRQLPDGSHEFSREWR